MMRKFLCSVSITLILMMMLTVSASASYPITAKIIAAQHDWVGYVNVWGFPDGSLDLKVEMEPSSVKGWCLTDAAVHVATSLDDFPQNRGGAIPGQFDYKYDFGGCITEPYTMHIAKGEWEHGDQLYIAVHVNAYSPDGQQETGWAVFCGQLEATQFPGRNWSAYLVFHADAWY